MIVVVVLLLVLQLLPRILAELGLSEFLGLVSVRVVNWVALAVVAYVVCGLIIALLPDVPTRIRIRSWGVLFATVWMLGSSAVFGLYTSLSNTVGAAVVAFGTPIVLMLWFYLVFMGILIGARSKLSGQVSRSHLVRRRSRCRRGSRQSSHPLRRRWVPNRVMA